MEIYVKEKTESIEKLHVERRSALAWKTMHEVIKRKGTPLTKIKGSSKNGRIQSWYNHFKNLLGKENLDTPNLSSTFFNHKVSDPLPINTNQFTLEELQTCLAKMPLAQITYQPCYRRIITFIPNCYTSAMKH